MSELCRQCGLEQRPQLCSFQAQAPFVFAWPDLGSRSVNRTLQVPNLRSQVRQHLEARQRFSVGDIGEGSTAP